MTQGGTVTDRHHVGTTLAALWTKGNWPSEEARQRLKRQVEVEHQSGRNIEEGLSARMSPGCKVESRESSHPVLPPVGRDNSRLKKGRLPTIDSVLPILLEPSHVGRSGSSSAPTLASISFIRRRTQSGSYQRSSRSRSGSSSSARSPCESGRPRHHPNDGHRQHLQASQPPHRSWRGHHHRMAGCCAVTEPGLWGALDVDYA